MGVCLRIRVAGVTLLNGGKGTRDRKDDRCQRSFE